MAYFVNSSEHLRCRNGQSSDLAKKHEIPTFADKSNQLKP